MDTSEVLKKAVEQINKQEQEIKRLNKYLTFYEDLCEKQRKEIKRLNNIKLLRR